MMKKWKRCVLSMLSVGSILTLSMGIPPTSAASETAVMTYTEVWGMEGLKAGVQQIGSLVSHVDKETYQFRVITSAQGTGKALEITHLAQTGVSSDADLRFGQYDKTSITDWTGAEELWFYADLSDYGTQPVKMRLGIQETKQSGGDKALRPRPGSIVYYCSDGGDSWQSSEVNGVETFLDSNKFTLPAGFHGWVRIPLDRETLECYAGTDNGRVDLGRVHQINLLVEGNDTTVGKSAVLDSFGIVGGAVDGEPLPVTLAGKTPEFLPEAKRNPRITLYRDGVSEPFHFWKPDSQPGLIARAVQSPGNGTLELDSINGTLRYRPNCSFSGQDEFTLRLVDMSGRYASLSVAVTVLDASDPQGTLISGELPEPNGQRATANLSNMNLQGKVGERLDWNITEWQEQALGRNPYIIGAIEDGVSGRGDATMDWRGEFPGKLLTGMVQSYRLTASASLRSAIEELVEALKKAQGSDGYLGTYTGAKRFVTGWDLWNHYQIIYGLLEWNEVSGDASALQTAVKAMDCINAFFANGDKPFTAAGNVLTNFSIGHAYGLMYQKTGNTAYRSAMEKLVQRDWASTYDWGNKALPGIDFCNSGGNRWECLHALQALGVLYDLGDSQSYRMLEELWWSILKTDRHNTGGFSTHESAIGTPFMNGIIETCCTVSWMALSTEYLQVSKNSLVADELELSYFNAMLGSLTEDDTHVTYNTPMDGVRIASQTNVDLVYTAGQAADGAREFNCCQANAARGLSSIAEWGVLANDTSLYLNYYGPSAAQAKTPGGNEITIEQSTQYPKNGAIRIQLTLDASETFTLCLRIPSWSADSDVVVNGVRYPGVRAGSYCEILREWKSGDVIELTLDMTVHYWQGEDLCEGKTAVYYGPILLALDGLNANEEIGAILPSPVFSNEDFETRMTVSDGSPTNCWLYFDVTTAQGETVRLVDFSSAGQYRQPYLSWLTVEHNLPYTPFIKGGLPQWSARTAQKTHEVHLLPSEGGSVSVSSRSVLHGRGVEIQSTAQDGKVLLDVVANGVSLGARENVILPNVCGDVTVSAVFGEPGEKRCLMMTEPAERGVITPSIQSVAFAAEQEIVLQPQNGCFVDAVFLNGQYLGRAGRLRLQKVESHSLVTARFGRFGDLDGNESIDATDALRALQHSVRLITLESTQALAADVNADESIDAADALLILQHSVDLIDKFPADRVDNTCIDIK